jgi:hypothetical protein
MSYPHPRQPTVWVFNRKASERSSWKSREISCVWVETRQLNEKKSWRAPLEYKATQVAARRQSQNYQSRMELGLCLSDCGAIRKACRNRRWHHGRIICHPAIKNDAAERVKRGSKSCRRKGSESLDVDLYALFRAKRGQDTRKRALSLPYDTAPLNLW